jgi:hypothetical protein
MSDGILPIIFEGLGNVSIKRNLSTSATNVLPSINNSDVQRRVKTRYFVRYLSKKDGEIYEVDRQQYLNLEKNTLFLKTEIDWIIRGRLEDTVLTLDDGTNILIKGVISQNRDLVALAQAELPGIINHLKNYMELWTGE